MLENEYNERFEILYSLYSDIILTFYVWKGLQDKKFEQIFSENPHFWNAILFSLENNWLIKLAKIYEDSKYSKNNKIISVHALLPHQTDKIRADNVRNLLKKNNEIIKNIENLRHNQLAHNNAEHQKDPKKLFKRFPIKYDDVENLLKLSHEILSNLHPKTDHGFVFDILAKESERGSKDIVKKLKYYSKLHREHMDKFVRGEIDDPNFPLVK